MTDVNALPPLPTGDAKTPVEGPLWPGLDARNEWPTHEAKFGRGGFELVDGIAERDAISKDRRLGKVVYVTADADGDPAMFFWDDITESWEDLEVPEGWKQTGGLVSGGIELDDGTTDLAGVNSLLLEGLRLESGKTPKLVVANKWSMQGSQYGGEGYKVIVETPLTVFDDPDEVDAVRLGLSHGEFQKAFAPGYLAYLEESVEVIGKADGGMKKGDVWFDDTVWPAGSYLELDRAGKSVGIQEYDGGDPNVTGGQAFLIAYRAAFRGVADKAGVVRIALRKKVGGDYLKDVNGNALAVQRSYTAGEKLGELEVVGVVLAKGLTEFQCWVEDEMGQPIVLGDRTEGGSGLMVQAIGKDSKTGPALLQFENDTRQNLLFSSHWMEKAIMDFAWMVSGDQAETELAAGAGEILPNGWHFYNSGVAKIGVEAKHLVISSNDAGDLCYFNVGKVFSAEKTKLLEGKVLDVKATLVDKDNGFNIHLVKWTGAPDGYGKKIISGVVNMQPTLEKGWEIADTLFVSEDAVAGDHVVEKEMTVPVGAVNFAILVVPVEEVSPLVLRLKDLEADLKEPFTGYVMKAPVSAGEMMLRSWGGASTLTQDNEGNYGLRYTLTNKPLPVPVGMFRHNGLGLTLDTSVNLVPGSDADGGEGAIMFSKEGRAVVNTTVYAWPGEKIPAGGQSSVRFWWSTVRPDGGLDKIDESEVTAVMKKGDLPTMIKLPPFGLKVVAGDRIALSSQADFLDGVFLESKDPAKPLVKVVITEEGLGPVPMVY